MMSEDVRPRRLEYHDRFALQQADQAIRKDVVRALVELITNSNDSYYRLESNGSAEQSSGEIIIEVQRKVKNAVIRVRDYAEGMSSRTMNEKVGTYGAPTSGFLEGKSVRGLWGRGLKDSFYGLGHGRVISIRNEKLYIARLFIEDGAPMYDPPDEAIPVTPEIREQYQIPQGNGTIMELVLARPDVPVPRIDTLRFKLQQHFELRTIMNNPERKITLRELNRYGKIKQELPLHYKSPVGIRIYNEAFYMTGSPALVHLEVFRSDQPLTTVSEVGDFADGGLLVVSKRVVMALTLMKYEHSEFANRVYGTISCDYLHDLLQKEETEPILTATRDGLNWDHPFMQELKEVVEGKLEPLIQAERRLAQQAATVVVDKHLRKRFNSALRHLNSIASQVLYGQSSPKQAKARPAVPFNGFGFTRELVCVQTGRSAGLVVRAELNGELQPGDIVEVSSEHPEVRVLTSYVELAARRDFADIAEARIEIEGVQVGVEAIVAAQMRGKRAETLVRVLSKPQHQEPSGTSRSFVTEIEFNPTADPRQRAYFDREAGKIMIATKAPSVAQYLGDNGLGVTTAAGQVLLAELVADVLCREVARVGVANGKLPAFHESMEASVQAHYQRLMHVFAHEIHAYFVDPQHRRDIALD